MSTRIIHILPTGKSLCGKSPSQWGEHHDWCRPEQREKIFLENQCIGCFGGPVARLTKEVVEGLSPGIRGAVLWLNLMGFHTVDSGDGSNYANGMEGAMEIPMIAIKSRHNHLIEESRHLFEVLKKNLPSAAMDMPNGVQVEGTYWPRSDTALILITEYGNFGYLRGLGS